MKTIIYAPKKLSELPSGINSKRSTPNSIIKKKKKKILKAVRDKQHITYKGSLIRLKAHLSLGTWMPKGSG